MKTPISLSLKSILLTTSILLTVGFSISMAVAKPIPTIIAQGIDKDNKINNWRNVKLLHTLKGHTSAIESLAFASDSQILFSGGSTNEPRLRLWQVSNGCQLNDVRVHRTAVTSLVTSLDGNILATSSEDGGMSLWTLANGEFSRMFIDHSSNILALAITPNSRRLVSGGLDGIRVWDLENQRPYYTLVRFENPTYALAIHPNNSLLVSGTEVGKVQFWNLTTGNRLSEFIAHQQQISALAFTPDGRYLITASHDRRVKVWNLTTGRLLQVLVGHPDQVRAIAVHPGGRIIASSSYDGIRLWDIATGVLISQFKGHRDWVQSLAFSPDGSVLASGGFDQVINLWQSVPLERVEGEIVTHR